MKTFDLDVLRLTSGWGMLDSWCSWFLLGDTRLGAVGVYVPKKQELCVLRLRESNKAGLGWINRTIITEHRASSSHLPCFLPSLSSSLRRQQRSSGATIYILIHPFAAAVEAVMDGVLPEPRRCHELAR